jgi:hypothetical protein
MTSLLTAACAVDPTNPPAPKGTVFTGTAGFSSQATDAAGGCDADCGGVATIAPGFRAAVDKGSGDVATLDAGVGNTQALSNGTIVVLNPTIFDGNTAYNFSFQCQSKPGTYKAVMLQTWLVSADFTAAGVSYSETVSGVAAPAVASEVSGTFTVQSMTSSNMIGTFKGSAKVSGQTRGLTAEFNVPVSEQ